MKNILLFTCMLLTSVNVIAETYYMIPHWLEPSERTNNKTFSKDEIGYFTSYNADCNTGIISGIRTDKILPTVRKQFITSNKPEICLRYTVTDLDGLKSKYSDLFIIRDYRTPKSVECIPKENNVIVDKVIPNTVADFKVTQVGNTLEYLFTYVDPTTYNNGTLLPTNAVVKRYIFGNNKWIKDVRVNETSFTLFLTTGYYEFEMEVEILVNNIRSGSKRSVMIPVTVE